MVNDHDHQIYDLCKTAFEKIGTLGSEEEKEAAYYLIEQLPSLQEERREIIMENEQFHLSNQETINDIETLKSGIDKLRQLFPPNLDLENCSDYELIECLKEKLDLVQERIEEQKKGERVSKAIDLRLAFDQLSKKLYEEGLREKQLED